MFIFNFKVNGSKIFKIIFTCMTLALIFLVVFVTYKVFYGAKNNTKACMPQSDVFMIEPNNYTNVLKVAHENIDNYVGKKINFTGYVYRVIDFEENQFVLARKMYISDNKEYVIVGFLCEYDDIKDFQDGTWINVTGEIVKGNYHGDMPIVKITEINTCKAPKDEFVMPPDNTYIPTITWL